MADFAKRPEVTIHTMGKVRNPSGEGVRAVSAQLQAKKAAALEAASTATTAASTLESTDNALPSSSSSKPAADQYETKVKEGTAKRNIVRKKTADKDSGHYDSAHKKRGGHGKAQWNDMMMDPSYVEEIPLDEKDPIYDVVEDSHRYILTSTASAGAAPRGYDPHTAKAVYGPLLTCSEFKVQLRDCLKEYFDSCDTDEVIRTLEELACPEYHAEIVKKAISLAMDLTPRERELTSRLLTCLHPTPLSELAMQEGFTHLLESREDLLTDVPDATGMLAAFLARAVVDEVLPPAYLSDLNNERAGDPVIEKAVSLLTREHSTARLERVWGPGDGRPVADLKKDMDQLLQEYLLSRELDEAARCVKELAAPHFHHELVKRGVFAAMEMDGKNGVSASQASSKAHHQEALSNVDAMAALLGFLVRNSIVSEYQVKKGVDRLHKILPDLTLDVPTAPALLAAFEELALEQGCWSQPVRPAPPASSAETTTNGKAGDGDSHANLVEPDPESESEKAAESTGVAET